MCGKHMLFYFDRRKMHIVLFWYLMFIILETTNWPCPTNRQGNIIATHFIARPTIAQHIVWINRNQTVRSSVNRVAQGPLAISARFQPRDTIKTIIEFYRVIITHSPPYGVFVCQMHSAVVVCGIKKMFIHCGDDFERWICWNWLS